MEKEAHMACQKTKTEAGHAKGSGAARFAPRAVVKAVCRKLRRANDKQFIRYDGE
jgi:hypothetical protein